MSFSIAITGSPEKIKAYIQGKVEEAKGASKLELQAVAPHLAGLIDLNTLDESLVGIGGETHVVLKLSAHGHGTYDSAREKFTAMSANVTIERLYNVQI